MKEIYLKTIQAVADGARFSVNFRLRNLRVNGAYVIKHGEYEGDINTPFDDSPPLEVIENLYEAYKYSRPTQRSESVKRKYFIALPEDKLSDEDLIFGESRDVAQIQLELFLLVCMIKNTLKWEDFADGQWFWKSPNIEGLILLQKWFKPTNND